MYEGGNKELLEVKPVLNIWNKKQKRAFNSILTGCKIARKQNEIVRFLTLTTSDLQNQNVEYDDKKLNDSIEKLKKRIKRLTVTSLIKDGYIKVRIMFFGDYSCFCGVHTTDLGAIRPYFFTSRSNTLDKRDPFRL